jgi:hypothetical protein
MQILLTNMQSIAGHMISTYSLSQRLGGMYCLYCLYETQPFKPPFKMYFSLGISALSAWTLSLMYLILRFSLFWWGCAMCYAILWSFSSNSLCLSEWQVMCKLAFKLILLSFLLELIDYILLCDFWLFWMIFAQ